MSSDNPSPNWWVYLIRTSSNALYCGITTDVERRFSQHEKGQGAKALRGKGPLTLAWQYELGPLKGEALRLEYKIKQLTKAQKERLIVDDSRLSLVL
ncbi:GIY-YIG nuclease family protein [Vibrio sp. CDRSL-10 TSBA]